MCFLQETALNLVKFGLHSRTYYFLPHIGGSHPVLYFTIQATEKYSNSNVLINAVLRNKMQLMEIMQLKCSTQMHIHPDSVLGVKLPK